MNWFISLSIVLALIAAATAAGLLWRSRTGRLHTARGDQARIVVRPADVAGADPGHPPVFGTAATLLQFSSEFCAPCRLTHRLLEQLATHDGTVVHLDVDLTHRADLARRFAVLQTPTTLILDADGVTRARIGGAPRADELQAGLEAILHEAADRRREHADAA